MDSNQTMSLGNTRQEDQHLDCGKFRRGYIFAADFQLTKFGGDYGALYFFDGSSVAKNSVANPAFGSGLGVL